MKKSNVRQNKIQQIWLLTDEYSLPINVPVYLPTIYLSLFIYLSIYLMPHLLQKKDLKKATFRNTVKSRNKLFRFFYLIPLTM